MVAFGFFPQNFGRWRGIVILVEKEWSFSGADNVRWWGHSKTTMHLQAEEIEKLSDFPSS